MKWPPAPDVASTVQLVTDRPGEEVLGQLIQKRGLEG